VVYEPQHWISDLVAIGVAAFGALTPVEGNLGAQRSLSAAELSVTMRSLSPATDAERAPGRKPQKMAQSADPSAENDELFARAVGRIPKWKNPAGGLLPSTDSAVVAPAGGGAARPANPKAQERPAQSANSSAEDDELFARAAGRIPKWKNPAEGLLSGGDATVASPVVDGAAKAAAEGAGTPRSGKPGVLDKRKIAARAPGGTIGGGVAADQDKALGALPASRRQARGSHALAGARANETAAIRGHTETARSDERSAIQSTIRKQLDAFASGNGARAYSFAAPSIKTQYPNPATFLSMVREGYAAVYRHKRAQFGELSEGGARRIQAVRLTDHAGGMWTALYTLDRQPDGSWLISGCTLTRAPGAMRFSSTP
jgi:hypothetical protein